MLKLIINWAEIFVKQNVDSSSKIVNIIGV